jgi:hypothetical protein
MRRQRLETRRVARDAAHLGLVDEAVVTELMEDSQCRGC